MTVAERLVFCVRDDVIMLDMISSFSLNIRTTNYERHCINNNVIFLNKEKLEWIIVATTSVCVLHVTRPCLRALGLSEVTLQSDGWHSAMVGGGLRPLLG